ncbi:WYL domain-containing protein [candidate division TA06 bacterium]|uniref:WYL domain-containing protein n=1 Tax=candidate division TA06 bacterium TaxID=2250710 RepID=A0A933ML25_UNCT6|nr:WYL domain-containing protein [candidate division TA06 bacterium]
MAKTSGELERLLTLIPFLNSRQGHPIADIAAELGISQAQLLKDLDRLCLYGTPPFGPNDLFLAAVDEQGRLEMAYTEQFAAPLHLLPSEAMALRMSLLPLLAGASGPYGKTVKRILGKIDQALLPQDRLAVDHLDEKIVAAAAESSNSGALEILRKARQQNRQARIEYYSGASGQSSTRIIEPYGFVLFGDSWYAVAFCHKSREQRTFKISRIKQARLLKQKYRIPEYFDINQFAQGHIFKPTGNEQKVALWFSPAIARWILERNAQAIKNKDGSAGLSLMAQNFAWIARWVLLYGPEARIIEPKEARDEVRKIIAGAL